MSAAVMCDVCKCTIRDNDTRWPITVRDNFLAEADVCSWRCLSDFVLEQQIRDARIDAELDERGRHRPKRRWWQTRT